jgi:hypothetical protein
MGKINFGRVLLGGIVAAIVLNIGEWVLNEKVLGAQMKEFFAKHLFPTEPGKNFIIIAIVITGVLGIVMVWVYALIRPRLGPGVMTAIVAAFIMWFGVYLYSSVFFVCLFGAPLNTALLTLAWGLVEFILAAIAGAWVYKEA